jgi:hypothetical protein
MCYSRFLADVKESLKLQWKFWTDVVVWQDRRVGGTSTSNGECKCQNGSNLSNSILLRMCEMGA